MLDLAFVRDNLPLVEEKLRQRGMDPAAVLGDFYAIDVDRRAAITKAETMKARRNQLTEEFQRLRKEKARHRRQPAGTERTQRSRSPAPRKSPKKRTRGCATS